MYKYTKQNKLKDGKISWMFVPPQDAIDAGVVKRQTFRDGRAARYEIPRLVEKVEAFRRGDIAAGNIGPRSTMLQIYKYYISTQHFNNLALSSQRNYEVKMKAICETEIGVRKFADLRLDKLTALHCNQLYQAWVEDGSVNKANEYSRLLSVLINFCRSLDIIDDNPMSKVKKLKHEPRSITWTQDQVEKFLDVAFTNFDWRNVGFIVLMCYEWAQRPTDMRLLTWDAIDFDRCRVKIKQSKRGATVELPISPDLMKMLTEQKKDWDFQEYVVPHLRPSDGAYRPLMREQVSQLANQVKAAANLPDELRVGDLRKSAIVEMIDADVDSLQIMSVTGHQNIQSLNPYHKHTFNAAKSALERRNLKWTNV